MQKPSDAFRYPADLSSQVEKWSEMIRNNEHYDLIKDLVEHTNFSLQDFEEVEFDFLDDFLRRLSEDEVFEAYIEYFCYERKLSLNVVADHLEKAIIMWALFDSRGNQKKAAYKLGLDYVTLSRKLKKYAIHPDSLKKKLEQE